MDNFTLTTKAGDEAILPQATRARIATHWRERAAVQGYKPGSAKYKKAQIEFATGAMAALAETHRMPPAWVINIVYGDDVFENDYPA